MLKRQLKEMTDKNKILENENRVLKENKSDGETMHKRKPETQLALSLLPNKKNRK